MPPLEAGPEHHRASETLAKLVPAPYCPRRWCWCQTAPYTRRRESWLLTKYSFSLVREPAAAQLPTHGLAAIPPSERRLLFRLQAEHALYPARSQSPPAPAHNPLSLPVSLPHPRLAPPADTLVMVVCLLPGGTQVCPSGRSQPPDSGSSPGGNRPLRLRHHHMSQTRGACWIMHGIAATC